jgi:hypothetical protein
MTFEMTHIIKSKQAYRAQLATCPIAEKLRMLEEINRQSTGRNLFSLRFRKLRARYRRGAR